MYAGGMMVRFEWGSGASLGYAEFNIEPGSTIFGDFVDPSIPVSNLRTNSQLLKGGAVFCKMCSKSSSTKFGDSCWGALVPCVSLRVPVCDCGAVGILPKSDKNRNCGCNSGGWKGSGLYYGGYDKCNACGCRKPNAFTGPAKNGGKKGGIKSQGLRIFEKTMQEWALEQLGAKVLATSSTMAKEAPNCVANIQ
jgi:hypothetical protein